MWYWEVVFNTKKGTMRTLRSDCGFATMGEAFTDYMEQHEAITEALVGLKCGIVLAEQIVFDNERVFGG
jgi:hypothetical protein